MVHRLVVERARQERHEPVAMRIVDRRAHLTHSPLAIDMVGGVCRWETEPISHQLQENSRIISEIISQDITIAKLSFNQEGLNLYIYFDNKLIFSVM